jgi:drug/metabolite transporter (DMT)-like permease
VIPIGAAFAAIYLFWGGTFLAIRYAVADVPPLLTIAVRCLAGALLLGGWAAWRGGLERPTSRQWLTATIAGLFFFLGCHAVLAWAEQRVTSGQAALLMSAIPLWLVVLTSLRARRRPAPMVLLGLVLGIAGVAVLTGQNAIQGGSLGDYLALIGSDLSWAIGSVIARDGARPASVAQSTAMQLLAGGAAVLGLSWMTGEPSGWALSQLTPRAGYSLAFLVLAGTVLGFGAYTWLLQVVTPAAVGTYAFVNPVVALALAWAVGDEPITSRTLIAAAMVLGAVVMIWRSSVRNGSSRRAPPASSAPDHWPGETSFASRPAVPSRSG